jgi:acetylornithine deacetylase/succinyl-diaminopimelate desuccinylase family protein
MDNSSASSQDGQALRARVRDLLFDLIAIPSFGAQEEVIARYLVQRLSAQGIACQITERDGQALNVVAAVGSGPRTLILNSHLDTVPPGDLSLWHTDPLRPVEQDGRVYGRGAGDAKGCLAPMVVAFEVLASRGVPPGTRICLQAVGAEERGGLGTQAEVAKGLEAEAAIIGEATGLVPMVAHKGVLRLEVEVTGRAAHASDPEAGINAVVAMAPIIAALDTLATEVRGRAEPYTGRASLVISTIAGGEALNVIPGRCRISIDRRVLPTETEAEATREIEEVVRRTLPAASGAQVAIRKVRFVPPSRTEPGAAIVRAAERAASAILGRPIRAAGFSATCDMTYLVNGAGIPTIILGPGGIDVAHQVNEYVALDEVARAVEVYLGTIQAWAETP